VINCFASMRQPSFSCSFRVMFFELVVTCWYALVPETVPGRHKLIHQEDRCLHDAAAGKSAGKCWIAAPLKRGVALRGLWDQMRKSEVRGQER